MTARYAHRALIGGLLAALLLMTACGAPRPSQPPRPVGPPLEQQLKALWTLGQERLAKGQTAAAADAYRAALGIAALQDDIARSRLGLARSLEAAGKPAAALAEIRAMPKSGVSPELVIDGNILAARLEIGQGLAAAAAGRLESLLAAPPRPLNDLEERQALDLLARAQVAAGRGAAAVESLLRLSVLTPTLEADLPGRLAQAAGRAAPADLEPFLGRPLPPVLNAALMLGMARSFMAAGRLDEAQSELANLRGHAAAEALAPQMADLERELGQARQVSPMAVGAVLPLTGTYAAHGRRVLAAVELGLGLFDPAQTKSPTLYIEDSQGDPRVAAEAVDRLAKERKVMAIIGPMGAAASLAAARQAQQLGVPLMALSQVEGITRAGDFVFQNFFTPQDQVKALLAEVLQARGQTRLAVLAPDNDYGRGFARVLAREAGQGGGSVVRSVFYKTDQTDFTPWVKELVRLPPGNYRPGLPDSPRPVIDFQALFMPDAPPRVAMLAPQLTFYDVNGVTLMGTSLWYSRSLVEQAGRYLTGALFPDAFNPTAQRPEVERFAREFREAMGSPPNLLDAQGYDAALLVRSLLSRPEPPRTRQAFREALSGLAGVDGVCGPLTVSPDREVTKPLTLFIITGSGMHPLTEANRINAPGKEAAASPTPPEAAPARSKPTPDGSLPPETPETAPPAGQLYDPLLDAPRDTGLPGRLAPAATVPR